MNESAKPSPSRRAVLTGAAALAAAGFVPAPAWAGTGRGVPRTRLVGDGQPLTIS